jgi:hypothetical protein
MRGAVCALVILVVALPGCGGGGGTSASTKSGTATNEAQARTDDQAAKAEAERAAKEERRKARERRFKRYLRVALLPQAGKSQKEQLRIADAVDKLAQLAKEDVSAVKPLIDALTKRDYDRIIQLQFFYIRLGKPKSEGVLIDALENAGPTPKGTGFALALLQSGNNKLTKATRAWASRNGLTITGKATPSVGTAWGCLAIYRHRAAGAPPTGLEC